MRATLGGVTTTYIGNHFEWRGSTSTMTRYYYADGQRVALRNGSTLRFLLGDHLGSAAVTASSTGSRVAEQRYHPWGGTRFTSGTTPTARRYTGQIEDVAIGLYFYNARYYDPALGRFIQADTIVPNPANPQSLNRYAYTLNNPLRYKDPSGHYPDDEVHFALTRLWMYNAMVAEGTARGYEGLFVHRRATAVALQVAETNKAMDRAIGPDSSIHGNTVHWYSHAEARQAAENAIAAANPHLFGRASHAIQDYYTHFGSGFTGYGGAEGVADYTKRLALEDRFTVTGVELRSLPSKPIHAVGQTILDALGQPRSYWRGHAGLYADEYSAYDDLDNTMRREYQMYAAQFAASWWNRLSPAKTPDERRHMQ